ncbi:MAG: hypothetical protein DDT35_01277 [Firmicutes bacterium]|nr:hypothetical protein [Bacillota bacterium]
MRGFVTVAEAAEILGVTPGRVRQFVMTGRLLPAERVGRFGAGLCLFRRHDVERFGRIPRLAGRPHSGDCPKKLSV